MWNKNIVFDYRDEEIEKLHRKYQVMKLEKEIIELIQS